jgi:hypothetical protein
MADLMNDVFTQDGFGFVALTDAINKIPFVPSRASQVVDWNEEGVPTTTVAFEQVSNVIALVSPTPRGGPGATRDKPKRQVETIQIPHFELNGAVNADEVQGVRAFGSGSQVQTAQEKVAQVQAVQAGDLDATLEYQRIGAIKGIITYADSTTVNLFTKFAVTPQTEVDMNLDSTLDDGALLNTCNAIARTIARALGGTTFSGIYAFASDTFWDALMSNTERRKTYQAQNAAQLRDGSAFGVYSFGGITFENYRGGVGTEEASTPFIEADKAYFFPVGVPRLFRTVFAPADYWETVNTPGLPRYTRLFPWENMKGASVDSQMNPMSYCTRPRALVKGKLT